MRGKRRDVVEVLSRSRVNEESGPSYYAVTVRLSCGHVVTTSAHNRYRRGETPKIGYCMDFACLSGKAVAA